MALGAPPGPPAEEVCFGGGVPSLQQIQACQELIGSKSYTSYRLSDREGVLRVLLPLRGKGGSKSDDALITALQVWLDDEAGRKPSGRLPDATRAEAQTVVDDLTTQRAAQLEAGPAGTDGSAPPENRKTWRAKNPSNPDESGYQGGTDKGGSKDSRLPTALIASGGALAGLGLLVTAVGGGVARGKACTFLAESSAPSETSSSCGAGAVAFPNTSEGIADEREYSDLRGKYKATIGAGLAITVVGVGLLTAGLVIRAKRKRGASGTAKIQVDAARFAIRF